MTVGDDGSSLLDVLREQLGVRSVKDGCSPQGQCGCCTVWVDGSSRVACVTPARRIAGRHVTTIEGLDPRLRDEWAEAFTACGASQCGFCTPGIIMRLAGLVERRTELRDGDVETALLAHLCRCTGWRTIVEAARGVADKRGSVSDTASGEPRTGSSSVERDMKAAATRATLEGEVDQKVGTQVALGLGGFADDLAPKDALVAVPDARGEFVVGSSLRLARERAQKRQGRNTPMGLRHPLDLPAGNWDLVLRTTFVEPAYLETDASWCEPNGKGASPLANGGAFGGKLESPVVEAAAMLAGLEGKPVRALFSREDAVRLGPKRPPVAAGLNDDGSGLVRVARTPGSDDLSRWVEAFRSVLGAVAIEVVDVPGPPLSSRIRAAGWAEAVVLSSALQARGARRNGPVSVSSPGGGRATADIDATGVVSLRLEAGEVLDEVVLRSYAIGAVHQALGWVRSEGITVTDDGEVHDLTVRSFGIINARDMPEVVVEVVKEDRPAVRVSDAVFAATACAAWLAGGLAPDWPIERG